jgi:hypothetical protein
MANDHKGDVAACSCCLLLLGFVLAICSIEALEPLEYGLKYNSNGAFLVEDHVKHGGRHFVGLNCYYLKYRSRRFLLSFASWEQLGKPKNPNLGSDASEPQYEVTPWVYRLKNGQIPGPVACRTNDGLTVSMSVSIEMSIGLDDPDHKPDLSVDLPELSATRKESLVNAWKNFGSYDSGYDPEMEDGRARMLEDAVMVLAISSIVDETAGWYANDFYRFRRLIQESLHERIKASFTSMGMTVHGVYITNIDLPPELMAAIQETELARQAIIQAEYQKRTDIVSATTQRLVADVIARTMNYTANKTAQADLMAKEISAMATKVRTEERAKAFEYARARLNYTTNQDFLTYVYLMSLLDASSDKLVFDNPVPYQLEEGYQPVAGTEKYAKASPSPPRELNEPKHAEM